MPAGPTCDDSHSCSDKKFHDALQGNPAGKEHTLEKDACNAAGAQQGPQWPEVHMRVGMPGTLLDKCRLALLMANP